MKVADDWIVSLFLLHPVYLIPPEPRITFLIEYVQGFIAQFGELSAFLTIQDNGDM